MLWFSLCLLNVVKTGKLFIIQTQTGHARILLNNSMIVLLFRIKKYGRFKLVSEPRFEGFEHNELLGLKPKARKNGCVRSETQ
ncbi:hypothetical protein HanHA300_Chr02g0045281 [Helianthus annuus]|nr:hypothetical protein HanHA300_Chr02g0045281 [Helianthus annuus]KAJ0618061.1 hypothetical protein HanHA89_Chr02g0048921 [Helianthus annuus]